MMKRRTSRLIFLFIAFTSLSFCETTIMGISGGTGSGKTTLAKKIKSMLGTEATIIEQDNYYRDFPGLSLEERSKLNFDCPSSIDFPLLIEHIKALKAGEEIEQPLYDFCTSSRMSEVKKTAPSRIIIVEGCLIFTSPQLRELLDLKIFMEVDTDIRLLRRIKRDQLERDRNFYNIMNQYLSTVRPMHEEHVAPSKCYADLVIFGEGENQRVLNLLSALKN